MLFIDVTKISSSATCDATSRYSINFGFFWILSWGKLSGFGYLGLVLYSNLCICRFCWSSELSWMCPKGVFVPGWVSLNFFFLRSRDLFGLMYMHAVKYVFCFKNQFTQTFVVSWFYGEINYELLKFMDASFKIWCQNNIHRSVTGWTKKLSNLNMKERLWTVLLRFFYDLRRRNGTVKHS